MDKLDQEVMLALQKDGRRSYVDLGKELHVTEATVRNRVKRLLAKGLIRFTAVPDLEALGYHFISIVGLQVILTDIRTVAEELRKHANVCYLANVTGRYDFIAIIITKSSREFADFIEKSVSVIPGVSRTETFVTLNVFKGQAFGLDTMALLDDLEVA